MERKTAFEFHYKRMKSWVETNYIPFCIGYNVSTLFRHIYIFTRQVCNVQGACCPLWFTGFPYYHLRTSHREGTLYPPAGQHRGLSAWHRHQSPAILRYQNTIRLYLIQWIILF
jgi:hypothetical protein